MVSFFSKNGGQKGFTLIEIIVVMVIMGFLVLLGSYGLNNAVDGYVLARDNAHLSQKAQAALDRIAVELSNITFNGTRYNVNAGNGTSITYTANFGGADETPTISLVGTEVHFDNITLTDQAVAGTGLQLTYWNSANPPAAVAATDSAMRLIGVSLTLAGPLNTTRTFGTRVALQR